MSGPVGREAPGTGSARFRITVLALFPLLVTAVIHGGGGALGVVLGAVAGALLAGRAVRGAGPWAPADEAAVVTGVLVGLMSPGSVGPWAAAATGAVAILVGREATGGFGKNPFNPAALGVALSIALAPQLYLGPLVGVEATTAATMLSKDASAPTRAPWSPLQGTPGGALGAGFPLATLAGGLILVAFGVVPLVLPLDYLATVAVLALVLPAQGRILGHAPALAGDPLLHLCGGGALLAAFFMVTDPVAGPRTPRGRRLHAMVAAAGCMVLRFGSPYPDGALYGVLLANALAPWLDRVSGFEDGPEAPVRGPVQDPPVEEPHP